MARGRQLRRLYRAAHRRWPASSTWAQQLAISYTRLTWEAPAGSEARRRYAGEAARWWDRHHELWFRWWRHPDPTYLDEAERRLEPADQHRPGALLSRTPDFDLAHEILARDRVQPVVSYLEACREMWIIGEESIDRWVAEIRAGQRPILDARSIKASPQLQMKVLRRLLHEFRSLRAHFKDLRRNR